MKALLPHSPSPNQPSKRPLDYIDPPRVIARQQRILDRWKAEGRVINQPRLAISLAIARQAERHLGDSHWGYVTKGIYAGRKRAALHAPLHLNLAKGRRTQKLQRQFRKPRAELAKAQLVNPYALPEKPMIRSGQTL